MKNLNDQGSRPVDWKIPLFLIVVTVADTTSNFMAWRYFQPTVPMLLQLVVAALGTAAITAVTFSAGWKLRQIMRDGGTPEEVEDAVGMACALILMVAALALCGIVTLAELPAGHPDRMRNCIIILLVMSGTICNTITGWFLCPAKPAVEEDPQP